MSVAEQVGAQELKSWVGFLRTIAVLSQTDDPPRPGDPHEFSHYFQRLVYPGIHPIRGNGVVALQAESTQKSIGRGPESNSLAYWIDKKSDPSPDVLAQRCSMLGSLITFVSNRRCELAPEIPISDGDSTVATLIAIAPTLDSTLGAPMPDWSEVDSGLRKTLALITSIHDNDVVEALVSAIHMHYSACLLYSSDISAAYALVVGGLETLAMKFGDPPTDWAEWDQSAQWDRFFTEHGLTDAQAGALRQELMADRPIRLGETFARYVQTRLGSDFWNQDEDVYVWAHVIGKDEDREGGWKTMGPRSTTFASDGRLLKKALKQTYHARSLYLHSGKRSTNPSREMFGDGPGRDRSILSFAQARAALRALIQTELAEYGEESLAGLEHATYRLRD